MNWTCKGKRWNHAPSVRFPGELSITPTCGECGDVRVCLTLEYPVRGTGPGGRGRLGDHGSREIAKCTECGAIAERSS